MSKKENLKILVRGAYDIQKLRIQMGNRICANFKGKLGQEPSNKEETLDPEELNVLKELRKGYTRITDGIVRLPTAAKFVGNEIISSYTELCLAEQYFTLLENEKRHFARLEGVLQEFPIYTQYLTKIKGCGPAMAGVIVSEIDISRAKYASSLSKYAGLDVGPDGKGRSRKAEHLVDVTYINKDGEEATRKSITFNPFLKTKLTGVLGPSLLKCGNERYAKIYYDYKNRLENHAIYKEDSKGHRHLMAIRKVVKRFLADLYEAWRPLEGLEVHKPYAEAKLGMLPHGVDSKADTGEVTDNIKRVAPVETTVEQKRVNKTEITRHYKRAGPSKITSESERAIEDKIPTQSKRASAIKTTKQPKRTNEPEIPTSYE